MSFVTGFGLEAGGGGSLLTGAVEAEGADFNQGGGITGRGDGGVGVDEEGGGGAGTAFDVLEVVSDRDGVES